MNEVVSIIIPTFDNYKYLNSCLISLLSNPMPEKLVHVYVVNNGHKNSCDWVKHPWVTVLQANGNIGWEGGLNLGLKHAKGEFVMFLNDDVYIPMSSKNWIFKMLEHFNNKDVAAVGPSTNVVMGVQNIFATVHNLYVSPTYLIGFCMLVRRSILDKVGGVDDELPGGDDLDLSIRFRKGGYRLIADRRVFIYHHGFKTGERVHGTPDKTNGWNSYEFKEKTDLALIRKHGFRAWYECISGKSEVPLFNNFSFDIEGKMIKEYIGELNGKVVAEIGCGATKTVEPCIGLDMIPKGQFIDTINKTSVADITADVSKELPIDEVDYIIGRHIIEHMLDPITAIDLWMSKVKKDGTLILATPDEDKSMTMTMNLEHRHAWNKETFKKMIERLDYKVEIKDANNSVSFIAFIKHI